MISLKEMKWLWREQGSPEDGIHQSSGKFNFLQHHMLGMEILGGLGAKSKLTKNS